MRRGGSLRGEYTGGGSSSSSVSSPISAGADGWREILSSSPMAINEITVDEPPNDTSGSVTPVYGNELVTTATLTSACRVSMDVSPVAKTRPNVSGARQAM